MDTRYNTNVAGALSLITVNGSKYQLGKDATDAVAGIAKLYNAVSANVVDGAVTPGAVYSAIQAVTEGSEESISDLAAKIQTLIGNVTGDDAKSVRTISAEEVAKIVAGADASYDTLKEIADWIMSDTTGAAKMASDIQSLTNNKADKVSNATANNFAALDANGNLIDSGHKHSDYKLVQTAVSSQTIATDYTLASLSQNAQGVISYTLQPIQDASSTQHGLMSAAHYSKLSAISMSVNAAGDTLDLVDGNAVA